MDTGTARESAGEVRESVSCGVGQSTSLCTEAEALLSGAFFDMYLSVGVCATVC